MKVIPGSEVDRRRRRVVWQAGTCAEDRGGELSGRVTRVARRRFWAALVILLGGCGREEPVPQVSTERWFADGTRLEIVEATPRSLEATWTATAGEVAHWSSTSGDERVWLVGPRLDLATDTVDRIHLTVEAQEPSIVTLTWAVPGQIGQGSTVRDRIEWVVEPGRHDLVADARVLGAFGQRLRRIAVSFTGEAILDGVEIWPPGSDRSGAFAVIQGVVRRARSLAAPVALRYLPRGRGSGELHLAWVASSETDQPTLELQTERRGEVVDRSVCSAKSDPTDGWQRCTLELDDIQPRDELVLQIEGNGPTTLAEPILVWRPSTPQPWVVFYTIDALRADVVGSSNRSWTATPSLDRLATQGRFFTRCQSVSSWTKPSTASLLTGVHPEVHGLGRRSVADRLLPELPTWASRLRAEGYVTILVSANPLVGPLSGYETSFDELWTPSAFGLGPEQPKVGTEHLTKTLLELADRWQAAPLALLVHTMDPHLPYRDRPRFRGLDSVEDERRRRYLAEVRWNDRELGRLIEGLDRLGRLDSSVVVVTADHGEALGEHGTVDHGNTLYQEELHVPLVVTGPRIAPARVDRVVSHVDVAATLLAAVGLTPNEGPLGIPGQSLLADPVASVPAFSVRSTYPEDDLLWGKVLPPEHRAVVTGRWKLIRIDGSDSQPALRSLFDLETDPGEQRDLAARHPEIVERLERILDDHLDRQRRVSRQIESRFTERQSSLSGEDRERLRALGYL